VNEKTDTLNCGMCGKVCSGQVLPACCGGSCADLQTNATCGSCDVKCGLTGDPLTCECAVMNGTPTCVAPVANVCI
jgi:hypothetical protein